MCTNTFAPIGNGKRAAPPIVAGFESCDGIEERNECICLRGPVLSHVDPSSLLDAIHSPICGFRALVDARLESSVSALSNAVSTSTLELCNGEWVACKRKLEAAGVMHTLPLTTYYCTPYYSQLTFTIIYYCKL